MSVRPRVYAAHPMAAYGTIYERRSLAAIRRLLPGVELVDPAGRYTTDAGWLRAWPRLVRTLSGVVVFAAEDGTVGTGCLREIADAMTWLLPVAVLGDGHLCELAGLDLVPDSGRTARRAAFPVPGEPVAWELLRGALVTLPPPADRSRRP